MLSIHHISLSVSNSKNSISFYKKLGFSVGFSWNSDDGQLSIIHMFLNGICLELFNYQENSPPPDTTKTLVTDLPVLGIKHFGLKTENIKLKREELISLGLAPDDIKINRGRTEIDYFFIKDPDGVFIEIVQDDRNLT